MLFRSFADHFSIRSAQAGVVKSLFCSEGEMVSEGAVLLEMEEA